MCDKDTCNDASCCGECEPWNCLEQQVNDILATKEDQLQGYVNEAKDAAAESKASAEASAQSAAESKEFRDEAETAASTAVAAEGVVLGVANTLQDTANKLEQIADELGTAIAGVAVSSWFYTTVSENQIVIPVPANKNAVDVQSIYIEGARQSPFRGFEFDKTAMIITLAEPLPLGLEIEIILGTYNSDNPNDFAYTLASNNGASLVGTASGQTVQQNLNSVDADLIKLKLNWAIENGYSDSGLTFTTGGTLTANDRNKVVYDPVSKTWYSWAGALPHVVAAGTNPVGVSDWKPWTDPTLRADLSAPDGLKVVGAVDSVAALRGVTGSVDNQRIQVKAYRTSVSGGGGIFVWDATNTRADDNGVIIKPTVITGSGRWVRECGDLYVEFFGAYNGATDNTSAFADAVKAAGSRVAGDVYSSSLNPGIRKVLTQGGKFNVTGNALIIVPSQVEIDLCGAEIVGNNTNTIFVTGGYNVTTGVLESNLSLPDGTYRITGTKIHNGIIRNAWLGYNVKNFAEQSEIHSLTFVDCAQCGVADSSWYGAFHTMTSRNPAAPKTHTQPAFVFSTYVNSQNIHHINVTQRKLAYRFDGSVNGQRLEFVNAEGCDKGLVFTGEVMPIEIYGYYEDITDVAIDMGAAQAHRAIKIGGFFNNVNTCFYGNNLSSGVFGENTYFINCTTKFNTDAGSLNGLTVNIPPAALAVNTLPGIPSGWRFSGFEKVVFPAVALDGSGNFIARQNLTGGKVDLPFSGDQGDTSTTIPFCAQVNEGVATRAIYTAIAFRQHMIVLINLTIEGQKVRGRVYNDAVHLDGTVSNITITPTNNSGLLKLTITGSALPATANNIVGVVRMP